MLNLSKFPKGVLYEVFSGRRVTSRRSELSLCSAEVRAVGICRVVKASAPSVLSGAGGVSGPKILDSIVELWLVAAVAHALTLIMW